MQGFGAKSRSNQLRHVKGFSVQFSRQTDCPELQQQTSFRSPKFDSALSTRPDRGEFTSHLATTIAVCGHHTSHQANVHAPQALPDSILLAPHSCVALHYLSTCDSNFSQVLLGILKGLSGFAPGTGAPALRCPRTLK